MPRDENLASNAISTTDHRLVGPVARLFRLSGRAAFVCQTSSRCVVLRRLQHLSSLVSRPTGADFVLILGRGRDYLRGSFPVGEGLRLLCDV